MTADSLTLNADQRAAVESGAARAAFESQAKTGSDDAEGNVQTPF